MTDPKLQDFKSEYPDIYNAIFKEGEKFGRGWQDRMKAETNRLGAESGKEPLPVEERAKIAWDSDTNLQYEFNGDFESFRAFMKADEAGQVKIVGRSKP